MCTPQASESTAGEALMLPAKAECRWRCSGFTACSSSCAASAVIYAYTLKYAHHCLNMFIIYSIHIHTGSYIDEQ